MRKNILLLVLIVLAALVYTKRDQMTGSADVAGNEWSEEDLATLDSYEPFAGTVDIGQKTDFSSYSSEGENALDGMAYDELAEMRIGLVDEYRILGLYPQQYQLFEGYHNKIYGQIEAYQSWLSPAAYFFTNPYLMIISTPAPYINPINMACLDVSIVYNDGVIDEFHSGEDARTWFDQVYKPRKDAGTVWLFMVNAWDAGFRFAHVDLDQCVNVVAGSAQDHITRGVHSRSYYYHVGQYGVNNISPRDTRAWVSLQQRDAPTQIYVKLWHLHPDSLADDPDLVYRITIAAE